MQEHSNNHLGPRNSNCRRGKRGGTRMGVNSFLGQMGLFPWKKSRLLVSSPSQCLRCYAVTLKPCKALIRHYTETLEYAETPLCRNSGIQRYAKTPVRPNPGIRRYAQILHYYAETPLCPNPVLRWYAHMLFLPG